MLINNVVKKGGKSKDARSIQDLRRDTPKDHGTNYQTNPVENQTKNTLDNLVSSPVDIAIFILFSMDTSIVLTHQQRLMGDLAAAQLLLGGSIVSEELCQPFTDKMERINNGFRMYSTPRMILW